MHVAACSSRTLQLDWCSIWYWSTSSKYYRGTVKIYDVSGQTQTACGPELAAMLALLLKNLPRRRWSTDPFPKENTYKCSDRIAMQANTKFTLTFCSVAMLDTLSLNVVFFDLCNVLGLSTHLPKKCGDCSPKVAMKSLRKVEYSRTVTIILKGDYPGIRSSRSHSVLPSSQSRTILCRPRHIGFWQFNWHSNVRHVETKRSKHSLLDLHQLHCALQKLKPCLGMNVVTTSSPSPKRRPNRLNSTAIRHQHHLKIMCWY